MSAVFLIQKLAGIKGGAERITVETARAMSDRGMAVSLLSFDPDGGPPAYDAGKAPVRNIFPRFGQHASRGARGSSTGTQRAEGWIKSIPNVYPLSWMKWAATHGLFAWRLRRLILRDKPDVIVAAMRPAITAAAFAARGTETRVVAVLHNVPAADYDDATRWDQNPIYRRKSLEAFEHCHRILVLLDEFRTWFPPRLRDRVEVMPNPIARLSPALEAAAPERLILAVGRLTEVKRFDLLIAAWSRIATRHPGWSVAICGTGPEADALEAEISRRGLGETVRLLGRCEDMGPLYDHAAFLCHPARFEGFGLVVGEALAHGRPVIGFAECPGVNTLVRDHENGLLPSDRGDAVAALAAAMDRMIDDTALRTRLSKNATASVEAYRPERIYDAWVRLLEANAESAKLPKLPTVIQETNDADL